MISNVKQETLQLSDVSIHLHGVFVEVWGKGILLTGPSGIGKSDIALGLLDRGHSLISDDIVLFQLSSCGKKIIGTCPSTKFKGFMEIRGLGILNISNLLGAVKVKDSAFLTCIGELSLETLENRAEPAKMFKDILGIFTPCFSLPYSPGRDMPLLVETMARISL